MVIVYPLSPSRHFLLVFLYTFFPPPPYPV